MDKRKPDLKGIKFLILGEVDESLSRIKEGLRRLGAFILTARNIEEFAGILSREHVEVIIAAFDLVDSNGIDLVREYKSIYKDSLFYILVEEGCYPVEVSDDKAREIIDDYVQKPLEIERFARMIETNLGKDYTGNTSLAVIKPIIRKVRPYFIFRSYAMQQALSNLHQIAISTETVLISGETGTGKELVARAIHVMSRRSEGPFVPVNCGAIPETLIEGELFGHEKGAFTGAIKTRKGKFESANNGTLFLDEIGDMPINLQVRLLRALEDGFIYRIGSESPIPVNVRIIAATRTDLKRAVEDRLFRDDLYYRLNVLRIHLPPLRERVEDISLLAMYFLERAFSGIGRRPPYPELSSETIHLLEQYPWKGNIRELKSVMTRVATLLPPNTKRIFPMHILSHLDDLHGYSPVKHLSVKDRDGIFIPIGMRLDMAEEKIIKETLMYTKGNKTRAASILGISPRTLRRKLNTYNLS